MIKFIKRYWKTFDDSLFNPPKDTNTTKNFKGQTINRRKVGEGGPKPNPEQVSNMNEVEEEMQLQPREVRMKSIGYGLMFLAWYVGATLFIMYRLKGDDLSNLEK